MQVVNGFSVPFIKVQLLLPWDGDYYFKSIFLKQDFRKVLFKITGGIWSVHISQYMLQAEEMKAMHDQTLMLLIHPQKESESEYWVFVIKNHFIQC